MSQLYKCRGCNAPPRPTPWKGLCPSCRLPWNCVVVGRAHGQKGDATLADANTVEERPRLSTGIREFDVVVSSKGGLVLGQPIFMSGPPGTGKTTLALSIINGVAQGSRRGLYASGEQKLEDILETAKRIDTVNANIVVLGLEGDIRTITDKAEKVKAEIVVIDSLQTAHDDTSKGVEGSAAQCEAVAAYITWWSKKHDVPVLIISHVNKDGDMAGPLAAQHYCDTILELDPAPEIDDDGAVKEGTENYVRLTSGKNRHGASNLSSMFKMTDEGLKPLRRSKLFSV